MLGTLLPEARVPRVAPRERVEWYARRMELSLLLIVIGIALAVLVHYGLGILCILIGLVLLLWPRLTGRRGA